MEKHSLHIKNPELQTSPEVQRAVKRQQRHTGEKVPNDPVERIEAYMDRLENIFLNPDERKRERNLEMFRDKIYDALIIKKENFPESYFELQKRIAREHGQAVEEIPANVREQMMDVVIEDQKHSLDEIINYLSSNDATYPAWFKYYAWNQLTKLSQFDKERGEFKKRTNSTVAPFPALHYGPLAAIADLYEQYPELLKEIQPKLQKLRTEKTELRKRLKDASEEEKQIIEKDIFEIDQAIEEVSAPMQDFDKKFPMLYAELTAKSLAETVENREEIRGTWVKYNQGDTTAAETLFKSLKGRGTGWCTADGRTTAETQIESGDFYVYYTNDSSGEPTQPRLAIRMDGDNRIGEVRGILPHQGVEPVMQEALDSKLSEFGGEADAYRKKSEDMQMLTALEKKREEDVPFTKDDLVLLYEINGTIEGFGYQKDPRIDELRQGRNTEEDMLVIFECTREQIAHVPSQINETTRAYVGQLEPGIFQKLPENLEHVYTSFPEKKIRRENVEIGGKDFGAYIRELESVGITNFSDYKKVKEQFDFINKSTLSEQTREFVEALIAIGINISDYARSMLKNREFVPGKSPEEATLIRLTVADLGFKTSATIDQIFERAQALGLELCPPDTGPNYRLKYRNQPLNKWIYMGMKQITGSDGSPIVFELERGGDGLWLRGRWARPGLTWLPRSEFVFRLRKSES